MAPALFLRITLKAENHAELSTHKLVDRAKHLRPWGSDIYKALSNSACVQNPLAKGDLKSLGYCAGPILGSCVAVVFSKNKCVMVIAESLSDRIQVMESDVQGQ